MSFSFVCVFRMCAMDFLLCIRIYNNQNTHYEKDLSLNSISLRRERTFTV